VEVGEGVIALDRKSA